MLKKKLSVNERPAIKKFSQMILQMYNRAKVMNSINWSLSLTNKITKNTILKYLESKSLQ